MIQRHRISTNIGKDQVIKVELKQDYDLLEILSLRFTQKEIYTSLCADYGVVCGRISVNNGLGVPNAKVSIFIPLTEEDENDPIISKLYPYKSSVSDTNENGYRYNLLPSRKQHGGHEPTGTFFDQSEVLNREEILEVYEKYYKYTVKTNNSGDFMIWGVPVGTQTLHVDVDLSDIGCFSLRPYDFKKQGLGDDSFKNSYSFKSSSDLSTLPQIVTFDKTIDVYPFWGNEDLCEIGLTRTDFDLSDRGVKIEPKAFLIGGTYTDTGKNSIDKNCQPRRKMGRKCDLITKKGKIESIRFTNQKDSNGRPILEKYEIDHDISDDGAFVRELPMNMEYLYTNEFGENEITNDPNKGVPTAACYRFKFSLDDAGNARIRKSASYLVPNIREYIGQEEQSYAFSTSWKEYPTEAVTNDSTKGILYNTLGQFYPRDYFYRVTYNKVYTVSSFQSMYYKNSDFRNDRYIGLKELVPTEEEDCSENVTPPVNYGTKNFTFQLLIADILLLFEHIINLISIITINTVTRFLFALGRRTDVWPVRKVGREIKRIAYNIQEDNQRELYLISYPECEACNVDSSGNELEFGEEPQEGESNITYCSVGSISLFFPIIGSNSNPSTPTYLPTTTCTPPPVLIDGATIEDQNTFFVANQYEYFLQSTDTLEYINLVDGVIYFQIDSTDPTQLQLVDNTGQYFGNYNFDILYYVASSGNTIQIEGGCELFDTPYDESLTTYYNVLSGTTIVKVAPSAYTTGMNVVSTNISNQDGTASNFNTTRSDSGSDITDTMFFYGDKTNGNDIYQLVDSFEGDPHIKKTTSGQSEFKNGIFVIVPASQTNQQLFKILKEYRRRKRVTKLFCGGIVNYSFIDNWLSGSLYFFQFKGKRGKYCSDVVRYSTTQGIFYYRSSLFNNNTWGLSSWQGGTKPTRYLGRPTTMVDLGPRDEFIKEICLDPSLDPNCSVTRSIGATSFQSFGELLGLAINYRLDVSNSDFSINGFFDNTGFGLTNQKVFDGDITQLISINNEAGIEEFDLQNAKYLGYSYQFLDPDDPQTKNVFHNGTTYGPLPVTLYLDEDGERVRSCLNEPGRLTESSQVVPFFLWDKKDTGFGAYNDLTHDNQSWYYTNPQAQPLQGMTFGYAYTSSPNDTSDQYLLLPMTYTFSGLTINTDNATDDLIFDSILPSGSTHTIHNSEYPGFTVLVSSNSNVINPTSGTLYTRVGPVSGNTTYQGITITNGWHSRPWDFTDDFIIRPTMDYYTSRYQILSTPFMFYFGLKAGKTGVDKFIELFGDKNAFTSAE